MAKIIQRGRSWVNDQGQLEKTYTIIECCGEELHCFGLTNTCPICGADYNWNGSRLAPGASETGESLEYIIRI